MSDGYRPTAEEEIVLDKLEVGALQILPSGLVTSLKTELSHAAFF